MKETIIYLLRHSEQYRDCYNFGDNQLENKKIILYSNPFKIELLKII